MGLAQALLTFLPFSAVVTITPGPDTALILRNAVTRGRGPALAISTGAATGSLAWGALAALGVAALVKQSPVAFDVLRYAGAAYLAYLGVRTLLEKDVAIKMDTASKECCGGSSGGTEQPKLIAEFRAGLLSDLLSPKAGLFFLAVLPQFVPAGWPPLPSMLMLAVIDAVLVLAWLTTLSCSIDYAMRWLRRARIRRIMNGACGLGLVALAARIAIFGTD